MLAVKQKDRDQQDLSMSAMLTSADNTRVLAGLPSDWPSVGRSVSLPTTPSLWGLLDRSLAHRLVLDSVVGWRYRVPSSRRFVHVRFGDRVWNSVALLCHHLSLIAIAPVNRLSSAWPTARAAGWLGKLAVNTVCPIPGHRPFDELSPIERFSTVVDYSANTTDVSGRL